MSQPDNSYRAILKQLLRRNTAVTWVVGVVASATVYLFHDWFHGVLLPAIGVGPALADALGSLLIIICATVGVRLASYAAFKDPYYGLPRNVESLQLDNRKLAEVLKATEKVASVDRLTGVWNRHYFEELMANETDRVRRYGHSLSLLIIDIDKFKAVNDSLGHAAGDGVLKAVAQRLGLSLRSSDSLCRYGGEEFVVVCPDTPLSTAVVLAERLRSTVCAAVVEPAGTVTVSIGVAQYNAGEEWAQCLERADAMLYLAKERGRNRVQYDSEMTVPGGLHAAAVPTQPQVLQLAWHPATPVASTRSTRTTLPCLRTPMTCSMPLHLPSRIRSCARRSTSWYGKCRPTLRARKSSWSAVAGPAPRSTRNTTDSW